MKKQIIHWILLVTISLIGTSCDEKNLPYEKLTDSRDGAMVFIAKANKGFQNLPLSPAENEKTFKFGVGFGGLGLPSNDIAVTLVNDTRAFDSLNVMQSGLGLELYKKFPENSFKIDLLKLTIPRGEVSSNLASLIYYPDKFEKSSSYLLALSITDASSYKVNPGTRTILITVPKR